MSAKRLPKSSHDNRFTKPSTNQPTLATTLTITGALLSILAYTVLNSTALTSLGISTILIGAVSYSITKGQPKIPPQASAILLQSGTENISALVEELGLKTKAIYLPSSMTGDKPKALIPLDPQVELGKKVLPKRLIVKYGPKPTDIGLLVITPGSAINGMVEAKPDYSAGELESAISQVLVSTLCLADGANATINDDEILVEAKNPRLENQKMWIYEIIGTPIASIVASVAAEVLDKPVTINMENNTRSKCTVELKVKEKRL